MPIRHPAEGEAVPVVQDGAIATGAVGDGRIIPLLILDTSKRPDIDDMVKAHHLMEGQGDVKAQWGRPDTFFDKGVVTLILTFEKPSYCLIILRLDIGKYGGLVDQVIRSQGVYIQPGRPGDRLSTTFDNFRVLTEVPSRDFQSEWDRMLRKATRKRFQREHGLGRADAKQATERFISEWRDLSSKRYKGPTEAANDGADGAT